MKSAFEYQYQDRDPINTVELKWICSLSSDQRGHAKRQRRLERMTTVENKVPRTADKTSVQYRNPASANATVANAMVTALSPSMIDSRRNRSSRCKSAFGTDWNADMTNDVL